jgi:hypothetical protein
MKFSDHVKRLQREYYCGKFHRDTAIVLMDALMHEFKMLSEDEKLIDIPDDFGKFYESTGFIGEFTVQHARSPYQWKRSYADRNAGDPNAVVRSEVKLFTEPPPYSLAPPPQRRIAGEHRWTGPVGNRKQVPVHPVLSKEEQKFFAGYESQVAEGIALIQKEKV